MTKIPQNITVIGAGINGLVAANYLARAGHQVTQLERNDRVGGACVSETAVVDGIQQDYPLGATVLGLMQDYVWRETGLADRLPVWAPGHPNLAFFPGTEEPARIYHDTSLLHQEFVDKWGERGDLTAFDTDKDRVVRFLQKGYRAGRPPSVEETVAELGADLTALWITGSARTLLDHYLTDDANRRFYQFGEFENVSICGSSTYPCGSVAGTPGYMCVSELMRNMGR